ncbi:tetratricopeptide repeat protein [Sphingobacterium sp. HJSM2_6]|uniref:tetratricopeptide repeat protein n=1 Tax=Sphingobacterium sp. HJSM2_6 TaxID=3366264 RepID=UPI003BD1AD89
MNKRLDQLNSFLEENPQDPFLKYAITMEYVKLGEDAMALKGFEDLLEHHEDYIGTYYHFGKFLEQANQPDRSRLIYEQGIHMAQQKRNFHALGELKNALLLLDGLLDEDDE